MANAVTSSVQLPSPHQIVQKIVFTMDTSASVVSKDMLVAAEPDEFSVSCVDVGSAVVQPIVAFDVGNQEVDFDVLVETGGTIGTHVFHVILKWNDR